MMQNTTYLGLLKLALLSFSLIIFSDQLHSQSINGPGGDKRSILADGQNCDHQPRAMLDTLNCQDFPFRTFDGTCNNISEGERMVWGSSDVRFKRHIPAVFGSIDPLHAMGGENRMSARDVSNRVIEQPEIIFNEFNLSAMVYTWGQFLDHDITLTPESGLESEPIILPLDEPLFTVDIPFHRSEYYFEPNDQLPREQFNIITAWVDGSQVYGVTPERVAWLRSNAEGKLKVSAGDLLPFNTTDGEWDSAIDPLAPSTAGSGPDVKMWVAGDVRAGEQSGLTALHTLFVREHNRICDELILEGMTDDEEIYLNARKKVIAILQKITFKEFMPSLGLDIGIYNGYDEEIQPDITNVFAAAAYRIGHTMVVDSLRLLDNECNPIGDSSLSLMEAYFNPDVIMDYDIDPFLKGLSVQLQCDVDPYIVDELRDFLFTPSTTPLVAGIDLASLNIQRGRDHGIPDYNTVREYYIGSTATSYDDVSSDPMIAANLESAYSDINDMDAWVALLCEDKVIGTSFGMTMHEILGDQFQRLRDGDRYYYENLGQLTDDELTEVNNTTLADVIMRNTALTGMMDNVMFAEDCMTTGVSNVTPVAHQITIAPNPSQGVFNIGFPERQLNVHSISVYNSIGERVFASTALINKIDLSRFTTGIYFIHFKTSEGMLIKKISVVK
ncbi:MAG: peroxidase [Urechidicola sp.]|jgi:peroxidase